jgi:hypothetical protein
LAKIESLRVPKSIVAACAAAAKISELARKRLKMTRRTHVAGPVLIVTVRTWLSQHSESL